MKEPIFIFEDNDYSCYKTVEDASKSLEAIDVINNIFVAYDSEGRLLKLFSENEYDIVEISSAERGPSHQNELKNKLINALKYYRQIGKFNSNRDLKDAQLSDLVDEIKQFGYD